MYELKPATKFEQWVCVSSKIGAPHTNSGIIVKVENDTSPMWAAVFGVATIKLYHVLTDFGNIIKLTESEMDSNYYYTFKEEDPLERFERQQELLREAYAEYFEEG